MQEIEKHMIAEFSVLELHLIANGHVFGALMFHLLGVIRICRSMQRLKVILNRSQVILCFTYIPVSFRYNLCVHKDLHSKSKGTLYVG